MPIPQYLFYPSIDPLSEKNRPLDPAFIQAVLEETRHEAASDPDIHILELPASSPLEVNALQRASTVVIQKSLREGFGLTVAEALWKKRPVVASAVGGIPTQVIHKHTGLLAHSVEGTAYQIRDLPSHPEIATRPGEMGHEHVREQFLITGNVKRYITLFLIPTEIVMARAFAA